MSFRQLKDQLAALSRKEQDEVVAFLFHLRSSGDSEYQDAIDKRGEDKDPSHWLTPDAFERELDKKRL